MAKLKFKDENNEFIPVVQDVRVNGSSVFDEKDANIRLKTINNQSIVGSGNINIQGGGGEYVKYSPNQNLTTQQKTNARNNIDAVGNSQIKQQTGTSTTDVISQKGVTDLLATKQDAKPDGRTNLIARDTGKLNVKYLPATVLGGITYGGTFNDRGYITASSYAPELDGEDIRDVPYGTYPSFYFIYSGPETVSFFGADYSVGDMALSTLNGWAHLNSTDAVTSVNGKIGQVVLNYDDIGSIQRYWGIDNRNKNLVTDAFGEVTVSDYSLGQIIVDYYSELPNVNPDLPHQNIPERARATVLHPSDEIMRYDNSQLQNAFDSGEELGHEVKIHWTPEQPTAFPQYACFDDGSNSFCVYYDDQISPAACYWLEYYDEQTGDPVWFTFSWSEQPFSLDESGNTMLLYDTWTKVKYDSNTDTYSSEQAQWDELPTLNNPVYVSDLLLEDDIFSQSFIWLNPKLAGEYTYFRVEPATTPETYYWGYTPSNVQADMAETDPSALSYIRNITLLDTTATYNVGTNSAEEMRGTIQLHKVSKTGNYSDLRNQVGLRDSTTSTGEIFNTYTGSFKNLASGIYSHSEGYNNGVWADYGHAEGLSNTIQGTGSGSHAEGGRHTMSSNYGHAEGYQNAVSGYAAHAEGNLTSAIGSQSHAEGISCSATAQASHAEGYGSTAGGSYSHAEGQSTSSGGANSHAEGQSTSSAGHCSHAEGYNTRTTADYSHAEGSGSAAQGSYAHAEGWSTLASGSYTHAEGRSTSALSYGAHAEGEDTTAAGSWSHAEGRGTIAQSELQHVQGKYNISDGYGTYAHIVGNGTSTNNRSNIHTVDWSGNAWYAGEIKVGGTDYSTGSTFVEKQSNKVTSISSSSTDDEYPTAKCVYDIVGDIESLLQGV